MASSSQFDPVSHVQGLAKVSRLLSNADIAAMDKGCEVAKQVLLDGFKELVVSARGQPLLNSKQPDATPITVGKRVAAPMPSGRQVNRYGK